MKRRVGAGQGGSGRNVILMTVVLVLVMVPLVVRHVCDRNRVLDVIIDMRINHVMAYLAMVPSENSGVRGATAASDGVHQLLLEAGRWHPR